MSDVNLLGPNLVISDTTPAAPSGNVLIRWQGDGKKISGYVSAPGTAVPVLPIRSVSANTTMTNADYTVVATTPSITITLPPSPITGQICNVKNGNSTAGQTITVAAAVNIDQAPTLSLGATASLSVQWDGSQWRII